MDPLSVSASLLGVLQIALKVTQFLKDAKEGTSDRTKLRDEMRNVVCLVEMIKDRVDDWDVSDDNALRPGSITSLIAPDGPLTVFKTTLEEIAAKLSPQDKLGKLARPLVWPFQKKEIDGLLARLERLKTHFNLILQNDLVALAKLSNDKLDDIGKQVRSLDAARRDDEAEKILAWISPISFRVKQADVFEGVQPGTGTWLLENDTFLNWMNGNIDLLWCPGIPGAGKTKLASLIIDHLEQQTTQSDSTFAYIYCEYQQRKTQTSLTLVSSLLEQVLRRANTPTLPSEVMELHKLCKKRDTRPTLEQITKIFKSVCASYKAIHVVLDALDECADSDELALAFVTAVQALGPNIRLLVTSRFSTAFGSFFEHANRLEISAHRDDVRTFLESRMQGSDQSRIAKHVRADPALKEEIINTIVEESRGMFLLVALHFESLCRKISRRDVRSSLRTLPKTLDSTYEQAMARICSQSDDDVEIAETVIFWILCARRPLTVLEIQQMYATKALLDEEEPLLEDDDIPDGDILTGVCGGLVVVDSESQIVRLVHYTAQEYFQRKSQNKIPMAKIDMTKISLAYLRLSNFSSGFAGTDQEMAERLKHYPFLEYAGRFWGSQVTGDGITVDDLWFEMENFLSNKTAVEVASQVWSLPQHRFTQWSQEVPRAVPALVLAASFDMPDVLARLVARGHDLDGKGTDGETPLIRAARIGYAENVSRLLNLGASVDATDVSGETALLRATEAGKVAAMRALVDGGADVSFKIEGGWTILMSAVLSGSIEAVRIIIDAGADLSLQTSGGDSALTMAAWSGQEAIATYLADKGAILPGNAAGRRASLIATRKGLGTLIRRLTADYETVARKGLQRQGPDVGGGLERVVESEAETLMSDTPPTQDDTPDDWVHALIGLEYTRGFSRRYDLLDCIGRGYTAQVWRCKNKTTGLLYGAKVFFWPGKKERRVKETHDANAQGGETISTARENIQAINRVANSFCTEIRGLRELQHQNIIRIIEVSISDTVDKAFLIFELAGQGDLFSHIVEKQKLTELETQRIFQQILPALEFIHQNGWVHRDIKPENILLYGPEMTVKLGDFDLCKKLGAGTGEPFLLTTTLCGTPSYVAPEVLAANKDSRYSIEVDIWSAGVVLYICLCGFPPFSEELKTEDFPYTLSQQIKHGIFDFPSPYWDTVCDAALDLIDSMLVVDPTRRFTASQCLAHRWMDPRHAGFPDDDKRCCDIVGDDRHFGVPKDQQIMSQGLTLEPEDITAANQPSGP